MGKSWNPSERLRDLFKSHSSLGQEDTPTQIGKSIHQDLLPTKNISQGDSKEEDPFCSTVSSIILFTKYVLSEGADHLHIQQMNSFSMSPG